jgi:uncharacterized Zn-binding protein involved in type VI secretion
MPAAARINDLTNHGGRVVGPGSANVKIGTMPAATMDNHVCTIPANTGHVDSGNFVKGSTTVLINGKPALRVNDACVVCGAAPVIGLPTVIIGG